MTIKQFDNQPLPSKITDLTINGTCSQCGNCCSNLLPLTKSEIKKIQSYIKRNHIRPHQIAFPLRGPIVDATCPFLNHNETKRCNIYPARPSICKSFTCSGTNLTIHNITKMGINEPRMVIDMKQTFFKKG